MTVLKWTDAGELRHTLAVHQPSAIQGVAYVLFLSFLACSVKWLASYSRRSQHQSDTKESPYHIEKCPFTIRKLNNTTWLIRENDRFGEHPHIYVKKHTSTLPNGQTASILIINDTGCGTSTPNPKSQTGQQWNLKTFVDHHLNPSNTTTAYLLILSHCHYDHILGLPHWQHPATTPLITTSSSHSPSFLSPHSALAENSLCNSLHLACPPYTPSLWAAHNARLTPPHPLSAHPLHTPIITLHTPGHTPDSLAWYDEDERALYVGDSMYERSSAESETAPWGAEGAADVLFPSEGCLADWWGSVGVLVGFVRGRNGEGGRRVTLSAGHVTVGVDAEVCLVGVRAFVGRVLRGEVRFEERPLKRGERFAVWGEERGAFSLGAPVRVVEEGRVRIPEEEW